MVWCISLQTPHSIFLRMLRRKWLGTSIGSVTSARLRPRIMAVGAVRLVVVGGNGGRASRHGWVHDPDRQYYLVQYELSREGCLNCRGLHRR